MSGLGEDILSSAAAADRVIRGSVWRVVGSVAGIAVGILTATLLLRHLGVGESGRYVTVMSLVAIAGSIADAGLNITGSRELALRAQEGRRMLIANLLGLRVMVTPVAIAAVVLFALLAGYPPRMVIGTMLAGSGLFIVSLTDALLLRLTVQLRNAGLAFVDFLKQVVTFVGVAALVALGAHLTPFFAIQIAVGLVVLALTPLLVGAGALVSPRFDKVEQRALLTRSLPLAASIVLGQVYFRLVIVLMSLVSSSEQVGYFGGSLRAMETLANVPLVVAGVALPVLAAAARDDHARLRYAIESLGKGAVVAGVLVMLVSARAAEPVMRVIGGHAFGPAGAVLRIQVCALLFIALCQIWTVSLVALGLQRKLILANCLGLLGVGVFAALLVGPFGAQGGAAASVLGDALLACLIYWRLYGAVGRVSVGVDFLARVAVAAAVAASALLLPGLPDLLDAALTGLLFLAIAQLIGVLPKELHNALATSRLLTRSRAKRS